MTKVGCVQYQLIASDISNLLRKVDFFLKNSFKVIAFFIPLKVGYLVIILINFVYKIARQLFSGHCKIITDWSIFRTIFPIGYLVSLWSLGFTIFQCRIPNDCYQILKRQTDVKIRKGGKLCLF